MVARVRTVAFQGVDTLDIDVQVHMGNGLPAFSIVGLPAKAVDESKDRVRAALSALGLALPPQRITVNLAPADVIKEGSHYDLPIAVGILVQMGVLPAEEIAGYLVLGELALDGQLTEVSGILPAALGAVSRGVGIICPEKVGPEAAWAGDLDVLAPRTLLSLINHFKGSQVLTPPEPAGSEEPGYFPDLADVKGQESAKRALEIAAAGGHNLLMTGPPGAGKSMLAARLPGLLPPLDAREALEVSMVRSVAGDLKGGRISRARPYRDPHHSSSIPALVGGGLKARPGEVSLAHCGVLFLDELAEFPRTVLDSLRQSIETGQAVVSRANHRVTYPARFQLIAAMNPCRCGYLSDAAQACGRAPKCGLDYQARLSGPLLDRFDLRIDIEPVSVRELGQPLDTERSEKVAARVAAARRLQHRRFESVAEGTSGRVNADLGGKLLEEHARPDPPGQALMEEAASRLSLSARGYHRILRVARTIADLEQSEPVRRHHVAEALAYRGLVLKKAA
ncbi:YifB family Mg chelatase-like AAA ATPase [Nisaea nitritireducens]|uniref:YifB family Mg chelatase-like AAA ATPase n=1 Tax=Nisaea nitritireducens TaxID=568392 RepID=UPI00186937D8|nr:YifB family Mg chelatase-like AAA ATPase [Nisaea nitritireducens]